MSFGSNCTRQGPSWLPTRTFTTSCRCAICAAALLWPQPCLLGRAAMGTAPGVRTVVRCWCRKETATRSKNMPLTPRLRPCDRRARFKVPWTKAAPYILFHPAGDRFVSRGWSNHVVLFDVFSGQPLFSTHALPSATGLRFDRTGERLAAARVGTSNDRIGLWSFAGGLEYRYLVHAGDQKSRLLTPTVPPFIPAAALRPSA